MKAIETCQNLTIPENGIPCEFQSGSLIILVTVEIKSRVVKVTGPRGTLERDFKHVAVELVRLNKKTLKVSVWFGARKHLACIRTVVTHINNMIKGVTQVSLAFDTS